MALVDRSVIQTTIIDFLAGIQDGGSPLFSEVRDTDLTDADLYDERSVTYPLATVFFGTRTITPLYSVGSAELNVADTDETTLFVVAFEALTEAEINAKAATGVPTAKLESKLTALEHKILDPLMSSLSQVCSDSGYKISNVVADTFPNPEGAGATGYLLFIISMELAS